MDKACPVAPEDDLNSHFIAKALATLVPLLFNAPQIPTNDGRANPKAHLHLFMDAMVARGIKDAHMCRLFPGTLKGAISSWFHSLPANSIGNFRVLRQHFLTWFEGSIRLCKKSVTSFSLQQH